MADPGAAEAGESDGRTSASVTKLLLENTRGYEDIVAGSVAGVVTRLVVAPLDVIKIRFQLQDTTGGRQLYHSVLGAGLRIAREEGVRALWKGNFAATAMAVPYSAVAFFTNQQIKGLVLESNRQPAPWFSALSGSVCGVCATFVSYPLDLLRTRFAAQSGSTVCLRKTGGPARKFSLSSSILCHAVSFTRACFPSSPPLMRSRPQGYQSLAQGVRGVVAERGPAGLFAGVGAAVTGIAPYMGLQFAFYDALRRAYAVAVGPGRSHGRVRGHAAGTAGPAPAPSKAGSSSSSPAPASPPSPPSSASSASSPSPLGWAERLRLLTAADLGPLLCGAGAGTGAKALTMPFDVVKKRQQVQTFAHTFKGSVVHLAPLAGGVEATAETFPSASAGAAADAASRPSARAPAGIPGALAIARDILRREGVRGLFKGTVPAVVKAAPASASTFAVYELVIHLLKGEP